MQCKVTIPRNGYKLVMMIRNRKLNPLAGIGSITLIMITVRNIRWTKSITKSKNINSVQLLVQINLISVSNKKYILPVI